MPIQTGGEGSPLSLGPTEITEALVQPIDSSGPRHQVALITGAASGIGRATALEFVQRGAKVVLGDLDPDKGRETEADLRQAGGEAHFMRTDVSVAADVRRLVDRVTELHDRLDYAFNNAGVSGERAMTAQMSEDNWDRVVDTNLKGVWLCMKYEIQEMVRQGGGVIVNTASAGDFAGLPEFSAYAASKDAVIGLTKTTALEYAKAGIRVNAICPGFVRTPMTDRLLGGEPDMRARILGQQPAGRMATAAEVAQAVMFLCSEEASFITGTAITVDGGASAR